MHIHDLQATKLHLLGIDHVRLTHKYQGRYFRLTFQLAEVSITRNLFAAILDWIARLAIPPPSTLVLTDDGRLQSGFVATETKETLTLRVPGGLKKEIPKTTIEFRERYWG